MPKKLIASDVAKIAGVTPSTVRLWERSGRLPAERTESGMRLFRRPDVEALVKRRAKRRAAKLKAAR